MDRLPLRLRLTAYFALATAIVLAGVGLFVYARLGDSLLEQVDDQLGSRASALVAEVDRGPVGPELAGTDDDLAQVLGPDGGVVAASAGFDRPALTPAQRSLAAASERLRVDTERVLPGKQRPEPARLLARRAGESLVVVAASLDDREEALDGLRSQLVVGGPVALLLMSAGGYLLAGAALHPVAAMRRRATVISAETSGERLPLPRAHDEIHRLGSSLNLMLDRLDDGLRRERRFVADAGHELRTPLALLQTELDLALRRPRTAEEQEEALRSAAGDVDRLSRLATALLLLATGQDGRLPLQPTPFDVGSLLGEVADRFAPRAAQAGRRVTVEPAPGLALLADRLRVDQALSNLVDNALRHGSGEVVLVATGGTDELTLAVRDSGPGFPEALLPHAFDRFTRADEARTAGGAGLGLAIVDAVAGSHGGRAWARNGPGGGAEVGLTLPSSRDLP